METIVILLVALAMGISSAALLKAHYAELGEGRVHNRLNGFFAALRMSGRELRRRLDRLDAHTPGSLEDRLTTLEAGLAQLVEERYRGSHPEAPNHRGKPGDVLVAGGSSSSRSEARDLRDDPRPTIGLDQSGRDPWREGPAYELKAQEIPGDRPGRSPQGTVWKGRLRA